MIHFTSDTHFSHKNILKFCPTRPGKDIKEMNEALIDNWNKVVKPTDVVYHLGDIIFDFNDIKEVFPRLNGSIDFLTGNHDRSKAIDDIVKLNPSKFTNLNTSYQEVYMGKGMPLMVLCHYPMRTWNKSYHGSIHLHGHVHGNLEPLGKSVDVGVDAAWITGKPEYRPYSLTEIFSFMENRGVVDPVKERIDD
jgi:calcineurin-like phosphoesterase family protein